ncbi:NmrA family NAD(P)-binding protein [Mariniluteicoccus flavus]
MGEQVVLVTGVTGKTGGAVARALLARGVRVRGVTRAVSGAGRVPARVELVEADLATGHGLFPALAGIAAIHHAAPNLSIDEVVMARNIVDRSRESGVRRLVFHSVMHPYAPTMPHHLRKAEAEHVVRTSGLDWTVLQPAAYHQNLIAAARAGRLAVPYALDRPFSNVDLADVAEATATVLLDGAHVHGTYELAGPEALDVSTMAELASDVLGRPVVAEAVAPPEPDGTRQVSELRAMFAHYDAHGFVGSPLVLTTLLGRAPTGWAESVSREPTDDPHFPHAHDTRENP